MGEVRKPLGQKVYEKLLLLLRAAQEHTKGSQGPGHRLRLIPAMDPATNEPMVALVAEVDGHAIPVARMLTAAETARIEPIFESDYEALVTEKLNRADVRRVTVKRMDLPHVDPAFAALAGWLGPLGGGDS
jgi:hypothetical protein